ncbi:Uncharacterised protein [Actinobacillus equuli]|nr:Uncharacterised protein [Actinobacillus equuli]
MAGVKETATWENHVYQIEENDPVHGGADGVTNKPIKHLANRTLYLRKSLTEAGQRINPKKLQQQPKFKRFNWSYSRNRQSKFNNSGFSATY